MVIVCIDHFYWFYRYLSGLGVDGKKFFWGSEWQFSLAVLKKNATTIAKAGGDWCMDP